MGIIGILLLILISGYSFYNYLMSKFVHFMNTHILVPPQRIINNIINGINDLVNVINSPFKELHNLKISFGKIFGKELAIMPFTDIIPEQLIPIFIDPWQYQCISEPNGYKKIWNYSTPKECEQAGGTVVKKEVYAKKTSSPLTNFVIVLIILLLLLLYLGSHKGVQQNVIQTAVKVVPEAIPTLTSVPSISTGLPAVPTVPAVPSVPVSVPSISTGLPAVPSVPASIPELPMVPIKL